MKGIKARRLADLVEDVWQKDEGFHLRRIEALASTRRKEAQRVCFTLTFLFATTLTAALGGAGMFALVFSYLLGGAGLACYGGGLHSTHWLLRLHERKVSEINDNNALRGTTVTEISALSGGELKTT